MDAFICKCICLLVFFAAFGSTFCAVDRNFKRLGDKDVEQFSISSDEGSFEDETLSTDEITTDEDGIYADESSLTDEDLSADEDITTDESLPADEDITTDESLPADEDITTDESLPADESLATDDDLTSDGSFTADSFTKNEESAAEEQDSTEEGINTGDTDDLEDDSLCLNCGRIERTLSVPNGGPWGSWGPLQLCDSGSYAVGYQMKIEPKQRFWKDNTALNAIRLICAKKYGRVTGRITSAEGNWGSWGGEAKCSVELHRRRYLTSFDLQVEPKRKIGNTAANYVRFKCRDFSADQRPTLLSKPPGHGTWGVWGPWSAECPANTAICGIKTRVQKPRGILDDTALNDVKFYCCY